MRFAILAAVGIALPSAALAALTIEQEGLARCLVDYTVFHDVLLQADEGETEEQALARFAPEEAQFIRALGQMAQEAEGRIQGWPDIDDEEFARLNQVTLQQADDWNFAFEGATDTELDVLADELMDKTSVCTATYFTQR